jgi:hypothetical protein
MATYLGPYDQYVLAAIALAGTAVAVVVLLWLTQRSPLAPYARQFRGIAQNFLTVINVIFALNLAFLANDTWSARDRALNAVFQEAGNLRNIVDLASNLPETSRTRVQTAVRDYATATVTSEWPLLARREQSRVALDALDGMVALLSGEAMAQAMPPALQSLVVQQAMQVRSQRDLRIALSQTHVNPMKWLGMAFLGFLTMVSIAMVHIELPRAEFLAVVLFATAAAPSAAIVLIHGNPFEQPMAVSNAPIQAVLNVLPPLKAR